MDIARLKQIINTSNNIVFFGGAGVSTESGIPDFRSVDGLYKKRYEYPPEIVLSHSFFLSNTEEFYKFYRDKMICLDAKPNITHKTLARLEQEGKLKAVITQNIDGLHQMGGSKEVIELHGSIYRNYCMKCHKAYSVKDIIKTEDIPRCTCGGIIKPDVVLYEEGLNEFVLESAIEYISKAEVLIIGGTSLSVYPAAGLIQYFRGRELILVNKSTTDYDNRANLLIQRTLGEVFQYI